MPASSAHLFRDLGAVDASVLHRIIRDSLALPENRGLPSWSESDLVDALKQGRGWGLVGEAGVSAFVLVQVLPGTWDILHLATAPEFRRQGLMRRLLSEVLARKEVGLQVWLEVHEANGPARQLYEGLGFVRVGQRPSYYSDGGAAVLYNLG